MKATVGDTASFVAWKFFDYQATKNLAELSKKDRDVRAKRPEQMLFAEAV